MSYVSIHTYSHTQIIYIFTHTYVFVEIVSHILYIYSDGEGGEAPRSSQRRNLSDVKHTPQASQGARGSALGNGVPGASTLRT